MSIDYNEIRPMIKIGKIMYKISHRFLQIWDIALKLLQETIDRKSLYAGHFNFMALELYNCLYYFVALHCDGICSLFYDSRYINITCTNVLLLSLSSL